MTLEQELKRRIAARGPLPLPDFIEAALHDDERGYYRTGDPLGARGDFITAPEISQVFGELLGLWAAAVWDALGRPNPVAVVELGPGRGTLLRDALRAIGQSLPALLPAVRLHLVETSPILRRAQGRALEEVPLERPPAWHERLAEVPPAPTLLIANEFFDVLPVHQYVRTAQGWAERRVGLDLGPARPRDRGRPPASTDTDGQEAAAGGAGGEAAAGGAAEGGGRLAFVPVPVETPDLPPAMGDAGCGEIVEVCPAAERLAEAIAARIARQDGAALIIDYGPSRSTPGDSLQAVSGHRPAGVLDTPGAADLSHHVDFAALARRATGAGARCWGPIPQGLLLGRLGAAERTQALAEAAPDKAEAVAGAVRRLMHPARMGLLFKALAITRADVAALPGFEATPR
jgi:NADH dehydrogenase [ubiquinone] 1 alpha subcomplex assembly factor 7